jgi:hypothetical protein
MNFRRTKPLLWHNFSHPDIACRREARLAPGARERMSRLLRNWIRSVDSVLPFSSILDDVRSADAKMGRSMCPVWEEQKVWRRSMRILERASWDHDLAADFATNRHGGGGNDI